MDPRLSSGAWALVDVAIGAAPGTLDHGDELVVHSGERLLELEAAFVDRVIDIDDRVQQ
jgi:hypothetical protein